DILVIRTGDPTITGVAPNSAFAGNPQKVTITGSALSLGGTANTRARFAGALASFINIVSDTTLECETPASLAAGPAVVSVENANGGSALPASAFTGYAYPATFLAADAAIDPLSTAAVSDLAIARDGSVVHATWLKDGNVAHCVSVDGGATWSPDQTLNGIDSPAAPQVVVSGANVIVLWIANGTSVVARRSSDGGVAFGAPEILNPLAGSAAATRLRVTGDGDYRYAAWLSGTSERVVVTSSSDGGVSWSSPVPVDDGGARQAEHELVSQGANAWITFTDERQGAFISGAYSARTSDGGGTWSAAVLRSSPLTAISSPRIAADGEDVHIVWLRGGELRYAASTNGGGAFAPPQTLANAMNGGVSAPAVACDKNRMFATFVDGGNSVWVSAVTATGSLPQNQQLSTLTAAAGSTAVIVRDNYVFATWRSGSVAGATARIRFTTSTDQGQSFLPAAAFGDGAASQDLPALAIDGARMLFCWLDYRGAQPAFFFNHN
ncbi:MAG: IPT/TIG domain-containing protein, partial [Planctomycetes bacterium]|nr:IPT/TIG domain-containing protein [Planctomycetota bacterium]